MTRMTFFRPLLALAIVTAAFALPAPAQTIAVPPPGDTEPLPPQPTPPPTAPAGEPAPAPPGTDPAPGIPPAPPPPPPPGPNKRQLELDARMKAYMLGEWELSGTSGQVQIAYNFIFYEDGSYSGTQTISMEGTGSQSYPLSGTWQVVAIDDVRFSLAQKDYSPTTPQNNVQLQIIDQNTLFNPKDQYYVRRIR